jgi:hypothetical protein
MIDPTTIPDGLLSYLQSEEQRALDASLNEDRKVALDFYHGRPFGDEMEGRSQLVTRDVAEVVDAMTVAIMRTVVSDKVVEFEARESDAPERAPAAEGEDPAQAEQMYRQLVQKAGRDAQDRAQDATALVAWQFMRAQSGYRIAHDCLKAGLLEKTGVFKTWAEPTFSYEEGEALGREIDADETIVAAEPIPDAYVLNPEDGTIDQAYNVRRKVQGKTKYRDEAVPNEEFRFSPEARELDDAAYIQHKTRRSLGALMKDYGITQDEAEVLWDDSNDAQSLADARDTDRGRRDSDTSYGHGVSRLVWLSEEYTRWDVSGDGTETLICVHRVGQTILSVQEVEEQPFVIWCPFPMHHRIVGQSLADKTMDIQRVRSVLLRQAMDALYFANAPRPYIDMTQCDENTIDDVLSIVPGSPIRGRGPNSVQFMVQPFAAPHAFTALEFMTGEREARTGVTRHNQGLAADTLNSTATGYKIQVEQGAQWEEYVARNYAEALAELFEKKLRLMKRYGAIEPIRTGGEFKQIDASSFESEMDMTIRVGLGTGRKDARLQARMFVLEQQKEALAAGSALVDDDKIYNSMAGIISDSALGDPNMYVNDPAQSADTGQEDKKDPATIEAEGKVAIEQQRQQFEQQKAQAQMELDGQKAAMQLEASRAESEARIQLMREEASAKLELENQKAAAEADMNMQRMQFEQEMAVRQFEQNARMADETRLSENREGGRLDA